MKLKKQIKTDTAFGYNSYNLIDDIQCKLAQFGVYMYQDPLYEGTQENGYILSDIPLSKKEQKEASKLHQPDVWKALEKSNK
mgnify:CR=1 FL=1